ncbi:WxcM-like domain-containing protein [Salmonella enterica subsp. enterica serovar Vitkin]|uniref:WxcM-like domain-containing protein n=3 Tax=Salmonella enterica TaxID=28901 RepID=A0A747EA13_SALER|nr:FdtA/QdtA family cupin domain-containing protein [Salmonella enterica]EAA2688176.1 WxcM-like domain-containing protein [Salmonella enterica subsp. enterica serovar Umbilo]EAA9356060.1 WxcM-like domain-containing protein [Salmonella enterica subsp. enterica]EAA9532293.1 WxcM-like domain-containing protein [Salmonella enterica subsp. enterica serovar Vitkin]EBF8162252.1 WxcM-like domain-containing protein [Salmonella enterica subsp. enterica serovar Guildford]EBU8528932.1 WxcM-like domain-con
MNVQLIPLQVHGDERGTLISLERDKNIDFEIRRVYYIFDTKQGVVRGFHAHKNLKQLIIPVKGSCRFILDDGYERVSILLDNPSQGLLVNSLIWREMSDFSDDCVLMILASNEYDESDYIRDYEVFKLAVG